MEAIITQKNLIQNFKNISFVFENIIKNNSTNIAGVFQFSIAVRSLNFNNKPCHNQIKSE